MSAFDPSHVDVEHFLDTLGIENITKATQQEMRFSCPFPNHAGGDESPSCYMNLESASFFCHGCKEKGTAVEMAEYVLQISPIEARRLLKAAYMPGFINPDAMDMVREVKRILERQREKIEQPLLPASLIDHYALDWHSAWDAWKRGEGFPACDYFFDRGFKPQWLSDWGFGYDEISGRIVFPIYDFQGRLIGFKGRATDGRNPKYLVLGDKAGEDGRYGYSRYYPSHVVFGAHRFYNVPTVVVCEGELNAIAVWEKTGIPAVAINGSFFSPFHAKIIRSVADQAIVYLDDDAAGNQCIKGWFNSKNEWHPGMVELLSPHMEIKIVPPHEKDGADATTEEIQELISSAKSSLKMQLEALS